jgi:hypothetical protein
MKSLLDLFRKDVFLLYRFFETDINYNTIIFDGFFSIRQFI